MKKIMFNDKYELNKAVLNGRKTQTRRIIKCPPSHKGEYVSGFIISRSQDGILDPYSIGLVDADGRWFDDDAYIIPRYQVGEIIAVSQRYEDIVCNSLFEDWEINNIKNSKGWNNKMYVKADLMPRKIRITGIRAERLQDISNEDCIKEGVIKSGYTVYDGVESKKAYYYWYLGVTNKNCPYGQYIEYDNPREAFASLIDEVSGKGTWDSNPNVFVYDFELIK